MTQVTLNIQDSQLEFFMELIAKLDFVSVKKEEIIEDEAIKCDEDKIISKLLDKSQEDIDANNLHTHESVMREMRAKYGL
jgi:hypothetical protein